MKLFIGSGTATNIDEKYFNDCKVLIDKLLKNNDLIYGAYNYGILNIVYETAKKYNRRITGVAPKYYEDYLNSLDIDEKILVDNIEARTNELITNSDAIIFLPGGFGTINEIFSAIDAKRSGEFDKPLIIYNSNHFYDELIVFINKIISEKYSDIKDTNCYKVTDSIDEVLEMLNIKE